MRAPRDDRGQTLPLVALILAFAMVLAAGVAHLSIGVTERARAGHAADAAALAGAVAGQAGAAEIAQANGATLEAYERAGDVVVVRVRRGDRRAVGRAEAVVELTGR
jgi:Flp pilus assembly protein TadG